MQEWIEKWRLCMAVPKSKFKKKTKIGGIKITRSNEATFLGVCLDEKLSFT